MGLALRSRRVRLAAALMIVTPLTAAPVLLFAAGAGAQAGGAQVAGTVDNTFDPPTLEVAVGTKVTWTLTGFHSVTGGKDNQADPSSPIKSELGVPTYEVTFDEEGTYDYFCQPHATLGMKGVVIVKAAGAGAASPTPAASPAAAAPTSATATAAPADPEAGEKALARLDERMAEQDKTLDKFRLGLWGATGLMVALGVAVYLSTRSSAHRASEG
jgi:plastocyanin